ncbi:unnamed protein product [Penicillium salamii]|nr:unnamed protein product [Penicillium salamii]CAG8320156.1 unnamed protein product [Penicillium salamii]
MLESSSSWLCFSLLALHHIIPSTLAAMGSCSSKDKCETGCCSKEGYCGFGPDFCGDDVCISGCDALAECGEFAKVNGTACPLNVCCSEFGFCGTTEDFCGKGCQSGCDPVNASSCSGTSSEKRYIGYYEGWNTQRPCDTVTPENINVVPWTHLYYSFAYIDKSDFTITAMNDGDEDYWTEFTALKKKKSSLKTYLSIGGWDLGGEVWSNLCRFPGTRSAFIKSVMSTMKKYDFDGIDIDWEYPAAEDRGGNSKDTANLVTLLKELRAEVKSTYEISTGLDLLWRNSIDPSKVLLGLGFYGRSFTLDDSSCTSPGCAFDQDHNSTGGAAAGECTGTSGILSDYEINRIIKTHQPKIEVSFDTQRTLKQKADFANSRCLGGLFSWALDMGGPGSLKSPNSMNSSVTSMDGADIEGGSDGTGTLFVGSEVLDSDTNKVTAIGPVNIVFPSKSLTTPTTISAQNFPTSFEVAWETTMTVTSGSVTTPTTTITRYIQQTNIPVPALTTDVHGYHNWNITQANATHLVGTLWPSISMPAVTLTNDPNPLNETGVSHPPVTRTVHLPPWPWYTDKEDPAKVTFTQGSPPGPTCSSNCGHVCKEFCGGPCLNNCDDVSYTDFVDPNDEDPPSVSPCTGPDCKNGKCTGDLCIEKGCTGYDCNSGICTGGDDCKPSGCTGTDCKEGHCTGDSCHDHGCIGSDCDSSSGGCFGLSCLSWGCLGPQCSSTDFTCTGPSCRVVSCTGPGCENGICTGKGCKSTDTDCETQSADICTEWINSTMVSPASTYSTKTVTTACETITACGAKPTTATKTLTDDVLIEATVTIIEYAQTLDADVESSIEKDWQSYISSYWSAIDSTSSSTSTSISATKTTTKGEGSYPTGGAYPNSFIIWKYHKEEDYFDDSHDDSYAFYAAYYSYREDITTDEVCHQKRKVTDSISAKKSEENPSSLGPFTLGQYTGCKYISPGGKPGYVTCKNNEQDFNCIGYVREDSDQVVDFGCGESINGAGTKTWKSYNKAIECSIY